VTYSFDRAPDRRSPDRVNKWTWYPPDVLPLWVADMDFRAPPPVLAALRRAVDEGVLGYELPSKALSETVAGRMQSLYGWSVDPSSVVAVTGIVSGFNVAARAFGASRKKGYLIQPPVYNEFHSVQANTGIKEYEAPLLERAKGNILRYEIDWDAFEKQVSKARVFILCNPHNPIGQIYSRRDLRRMAEMCLENDVVIISDEIHSELLLGGQKFTPIAAQSKAIAQQTITLVSPSKTFNVPGISAVFRTKPTRTCARNMRVWSISSGCTSAVWGCSRRGRLFPASATIGCMNCLRISRPTATLWWTTPGSTCPMCGSRSRMPRTWRGWIAESWCGRDGSQARRTNSS